MLQRLTFFLLVAMNMAVLRLCAQQACPSFADTPDPNEAQLMLTVNSTDDPQEQIAALDKFAKEHPDSKFMGCVNEYYASANLKLKDYDKSIEFGEKDLALNYQDLNLLFTLMRAYASSNKVSDTIFEVINKVPDQARVETSSPAHPLKATDDQWAKIQADARELAKASHDYAVWAFFQVIPRVTDPAKQIQALNSFVKTYPETEKDNATQINTLYFDAYRMQGNYDKTIEFGDKVIATDPSNVRVLNTLGLIYSFALPHPSPEKGAAYAQKALAATQGLKKPEGADDAAFKKDQTNQLGMAHLMLGYAALIRAEKTGKLVPAIDELKLASTLLEGNPPLQGQALYYLGFAYERGTPANHRGAIESLNRSSSLPGPMQGQARALLAKVKAAIK